MKILNKKILNKAATFLLTAVLLFWNAVQVEASTLLFSGDIIPLNKAETITFPSVWSTKDSLESVSAYADEHITLNTYSFSNFLFDVHKFYRFNLSSSIGPSVYTASGSGITDTGYNYRVYLLYGGEKYYFNQVNEKWELSIIVPGTLFWEFSIGIECDYWACSYKIDSLGNYGSNYCQPSFSVSLSGDVYEFESEEVAIGNKDAIIINRIETTNSFIDNLTSKLTGWFEDLFKRMDDKQNELVHGYQDTTTSEAASAFSSESDKLTALEGELSTQSNTYVTDYAAEGFDLGVLATIGSSLIFVTTWFTNFWNIGGVFTACLNFCFALSIVFFILRMKR